MPTPHANVILPFIEEVWNAGNIADLERYVHHEYSVDGVIVGIEWVQTNVQSFRLAFPDIHVHVDRLIEDESGAALLLRLRGTHLGEWKGWPPTGRRVDYREAAFWTVTGGKLVSGRFVADTLSLRVQLGIIPATLWQAAHTPDQAT